MDSNAESLPRPPVTPDLTPLLNRIEILENQLGRTLSLLTKLTLVRENDSNEVQALVTKIEHIGNSNGELRKLINDHTTQLQALASSTAKLALVGLAHETRIEKLESPSPSPSPLPPQPSQN